MGNMEPDTGEKKHHPKAWVGKVLVVALMVYLVAVLLFNQQGFSRRHMLLSRSTEASLGTQDGFGVPCVEGRIPFGLAVINGSYSICTNAKCGSSTFMELTKLAMDNFSFRSHKNYIDPAENHGTCTVLLRKNGSDFHAERNTACTKYTCGMPSIVPVRNPWDRVASAYRDKLEGCDHPGSTIPILNCNQFKDFIKSHPFGNRTFANFLRFWVKDHADENIHTMRYNTRCLTKDYPYSRVLYLEHGLLTGYADFFHNNLANYPALSTWESMARQMSHETKTHCTKNCKAETDYNFEARIISSAMAERKKYYMNESISGMLKHPTELIDIVADVYKDDIEQFGYSFTMYGPATST